jgi:micrococcal nuclease
VTHRRVAALLVPLLLVAGCEGVAPPPATVSRRAAPEPVFVAAPPDARWRRVERIIDGDTVVLDGGERVRLIGVDTAEMGDERAPVQAFARASRRALGRLLRVQQVRLEYGRERTDRHDRTLAYLFTEDGRDINQAMIAEGWSHAFTRYPHPALDAHRDAEHDARASGRGLWADSLRDWREALRE